MKYCDNPKCSVGVEMNDFTLAVYNQSHRHGLHASSGKRRLHLSPKHRRQLESNQPIEHPTRLLRMDQVDFNRPRRFACFQIGWLGNFMEHNSLGILFFESEGFEKVPGNSFSLSVLIGCEPDRIRGLS